MRISISLLLLSLFLSSSLIAQETELRKYASRIIVKMAQGEKVEGILYAANDSSISVWRGLKKVKYVHSKERDILNIPARKIRKIKLISKQGMEVLLFSGIALGAAGGTVYAEESGYGLFTSVPFGFLGGLAGLIIALAPNDIRQNGAPEFRDRHLRKLQKHQLLMPQEVNTKLKPEPVLSLSGY